MSYLTQIDIEEFHQREFEWQNSLIDYKSYDRLVEYIESTLYQSLPLIKFPSPKALQILLTLAVISSHFHYFKVNVNNDNVRPLNLRALDILINLCELASIDNHVESNNNENAKIFGEHIKPLESEKLLLREQLFLLVDFIKDNARRNESFRDRSRRRLPAKRKSIDYEFDLSFTESPQKMTENHTTLKIDEENIKLDESPLKKQLDMLYKDLEYSSDDDRMNGDGGGPRIEQMPKANKASIENDNSLVNDETYGSPSSSRNVSGDRIKVEGIDQVLGRTLLHTELTNNPWQLFNWAFACASRPANDLKHQACWLAWKPIINLILKILNLEFDVTCANFEKEDISHNKRSTKFEVLKGTLIFLLVRKCSSADIVAFEEVVSRIFLNEREYNIDYIQPIYEDELTENNRYLLIPVLDESDDTDEMIYRNSFDIKLGISSIQTRKKFLYLVYKYICLSYPSKEEAKSFGKTYSSSFLGSIKTKEQLLKVFLGKIEETLKKLGYKEFMEFFTLDINNVTKIFETEFLIDISRDLLLFYTGYLPKNDSKIFETSLFLYDESSWEELLNLEKFSDPENYFKGIELGSENYTFNFYFEIFQKILLLWSLLTNMWTKLHEKKAMSQWENVLSVLLKGDKERYSKLNEVYKKFQNKNILTLEEIKRYEKGEYSLLKLSSIFEFKFRDVKKKTFKVSNNI